jgi:hypothetical protein
MVGKMTRVWFLAPMLLVLLYSAPALAQGGPTGPGKGDPVVEGAEIQVRPDWDGVDVIERITVANAGGLEKIEHIFTRLDDAGAEDFAVTAGGRELAVDRAEGDLIDKVVVSLPRGASGDFAYEISYRYPEGADSARVPLVVPTVPTVDDARSVELELYVPEGRYLHGSFPVIDSGSTGAVSTDMVGFPNYSSYELGSTPAGILTRSNLYTALALAIIFGCVFGLLLYDRRSGTRTGTSEVTDV